MPPFHWQPEGFISLLDAALLTETQLGVGAGAWGHEIILGPRELVRAAGARIVNLTDREQPLVPSEPGTAG